MKKGKSTRSLMRHMRTSHGIDIKGTSHKNTLLNMGYYHGYKRYRFIKERKNLQNFHNFNEIKALHNFDFELKQIFYSMITLFETGIKNRTIDVLVANGKCDIEDIYKTKLVSHLDYDPINDSKKYKDTLKSRLEFRSVMDETIGYNYGKNRSLSHFVHSGKPIPIWVFFELVTFGQFGHFIRNLNLQWRLEVSKANGLQNSSFNQNGRMLEIIVFCLTGLRNATMHNSVVFDANFNKDGIAKSLKEFLKNETNISEITFLTIIDYLILLVYILKKQYYSKTDLKQYVKQFEKAKEKLYTSIPRSAYGKLLGVDSNKKINELYKFISNG